LDTKDTPKPNRLEWKSFPDQPGPPMTRIQMTIDNLKHILDHHGFSARYNIVKKRIETSMSVDLASTDNADEAVLAEILSVVNLYGLPTGLVPMFTYTLAERDSYNPVKDWIEGKAWDGTDRFEALCDTVTVAEDYPVVLKPILLKKWLLSAVAAAFSDGDFRARGVLSLQGPQGIGKSSWLKRLVNHPLKHEWVKLDHIMNVKDKDSKMTAISHWIVEMGELESSFKHDIGRLKGFLTDGFDKFRRPYARADSNFPRRTVFAATVNDSSFLVDKTGNSRFWTIEVDKLDYLHNIDMQQLFAQLTEDYWKGKIWWLTKEEERLLSSVNSQHMETSYIHELVFERLDFDKRDDPNLEHLSASEVLKQIGIDRPTVTESKDCAALLREQLGRHKRIRGKNGWRVAFKALNVTSLHKGPLPAPGEVY
jgi:predicted P-loop ATPase